MNPKTELQPFFLEPLKPVIYTHLDPFMRIKALSYSRDRVRLHLSHMFMLDFDDYLPNRKLLSKYIAKRAVCTPLANCFYNYCSKMQINEKDFTSKSQSGSSWGRFGLKTVCLIYIFFV